MEQLKFELESADFRLAKSGANTQKNKDALLVQEEREREVRRYRETIIPPLEAEVKELRRQLAEAEGSRARRGEEGEVVGEGDVASVVGSAVNSSASESAAASGCRDHAGGLTGGAGTLSSYQNKSLWSFQNHLDIENRRKKKEKRVRCARSGAISRGRYSWPAAVPATGCAGRKRASCVEGS